jgi:BirA family biotin operon repressor/biotin-[acetyl-CoA-carboxylase] ligase
VDKKDVKRGRPALDPNLILSELTKTSSKWLDITVLEQVDSTNDLALAQLFTATHDSAFAITADEQLKGRGRLQREWHSPFGAGIALSVAVPTKAFSCEVSAIPLLVGIAANNCLKHIGANAKLKWPNDLMIEIASGELLKIGGILVQRQDDYVVIGIGINVSLSFDELPAENATSLSQIQIEVSRETLIAQLIAQLEIVTRFATEDWLPLYKRDSSTIGTRVAVARKAESLITGTAIDVLASGELLLDAEGELIEITSGDVLQVRPSQP